MKWVTAILVLTLIASGGGCRTATIHNLTDVRLAPPPDVKLTMEQVSKAIWTAGRGLGWRIEETRPGQATGTLDLRKHIAVVGIAYDTSKFSITYRSSTNLMQSGDQIHQKYNQWVGNLQKAIEAEIARAATAR